MATRSFVTARAAAELIGCDEALIVSEIKRGFDKLGALNGGRFGETWIVYSYEIEPERLSVHQARLGATARDTVAP